MPGFGGLWYAVVLYLVIFFLVLHLIDRLAHRLPLVDTPAAGSPPTDSAAPKGEFGGETGEVGE
jgi:hypothetical protein